MIFIAHISDLHLDGGERSAARAEKVLAAIDAFRTPPDVVLATGDLADHGEVAEYDQFAKLFEGRGPVLHCPGNHDERRAYRQVLLGEEPSAGPINRVHRIPGATFLLCDSSIPGRGAGFLDDETISWLDTALGEVPGGEPAFVCFHHPPVTMHNPVVDVLRQTGEERLEAVLAGHSVAALFCGHTHTAAATTFAGIPLHIAPGVVSTLLMPWEENGTREWADGGPVDLDGPPSLAFHVYDEGRLITHYRVVS
ncbi:metallophosphoesterase [Amycolatopsis sp. CA-230715]|uniref:metallophosphoesterase n=1 Tax=Amycolatopsis sp. CA-230715 TaxID=2745196 RepID=UPI001C016091|nr:metallophosphoesterase [Amycolatopsis sp. CA-230715]QWF83124.1 3',5'-cyclic adenosine monophosphate phosphodiesterase CpdA [Amycolatopsis sp. CA-230715]